MHARYTDSESFEVCVKRKLLAVSCALAGGLMIACENVSLVAQAQAPAADSVAARSKSLSTLFGEIWEDRLKHSPEFASFLGDKRYNDQWTDYSVAEVNAALARGRVFLDRLSEIDTTGLTPQEVLSRNIRDRRALARYSGLTGSPD